MRTFAFIFARGGSKGLPNKNILPIAGKPLLAHGIDMALQINDVEKIFVSTDCHRIANIANDYGAEVIIRPDELATDTAVEWKAWQHAVHWVNQKYGSFKCFLSLPTTAPLRRIQDVEKCIEAFRKEDDADCVLTINISHRNPWFNMVQYKKDLEIERLIHTRDITRRQDAPECFDMTTVAYVLNPQFILSSDNFWTGKVLGVQVPNQYSIDIDTELDYAIAKFMMEVWLPQSNRTKH